MLSCQLVRRSVCMVSCSCNCMQVHVKLGQLVMLGCCNL
jgi:hypothetical protein